MKLYVNGSDIYSDVAVNYCVHEMYAEKQSDTLVVRFSDPKGIWSKWKPADGDTMRVKEGACDTGKMFIHSMKPENGLFTIRAMSIPKSGMTKKSKSWEGKRFLQLGKTIASNHGLTFENYGCTDQVYPYIKQNNETDFAFFFRLCELEGYQMLIYNGKLLAYSEQKLEGQSPAGTLTVEEKGVFDYKDNRAECFGSCEISSGKYSGKFKAPDAKNDTVLRPSTTINVTSNAEAARFAKGMLRNANKHAISGKFSKELLPGYAAASIVTLKTTKASAWDGKAFLHRVIHDYVGNKSTVYFRGVLEGY